MARKRKENDPVKLKQPDRSGPTEKTLLQLAQDQNLFEQARKRETAIRKGKATGTQDVFEDEEAENEEAKISPGAERVLETILWSSSLAVLHFTFDVLVQRQYAMEMEWHTVILRAIQSFFVFWLLLYFLHPHYSSPTFVPTALLPARFQPALRQAIFFAMSISAGCYLIYITNKYSYLYILKQAPSVGCIWIWSIIDLDLPWAALSLVVAGVFVWQGGYSVGL